MIATTAGPKLDFDQSRMPCIVYMRGVVLMQYVTCTESDSMGWPSWGAGALGLLT
jgi:hypothetical protein